MKYINHYTLCFLCMFVPIVMCGMGKMTYDTSSSFSKIDLYVHSDNMQIMLAINKR